MLRRKKSTQRFESMDRRQQKNGRRQLKNESHYNCASSSPQEPSNVGRTFSGLTLPPTHPVFISPHISSHQEKSPRERPYLMGSPEAMPSGFNYNAKNKIFSAGQVVSQPSVMQSAAMDQPQTLQNELEEATVEFLTNDTRCREMEIEAIQSIIFPKPAGDNLMVEKSHISQKFVPEGNGRRVSGLAEMNDKSQPLKLSDFVSKQASDLNEADLPVESASGAQHGQHVVDQAASNVSLTSCYKEFSTVKYGKELPFSSSNPHQHGAEDQLQADESKQLGGWDHASELFQHVDQPALPYQNKGFASQYASGLDGLSQVPPRNQRETEAYDVDTEDCTRCNCKRSRCIKLYCECFSTGSFCADACSCQECFNKPEYEDTTLWARQQIESRNPFAFAPKVVPFLTKSPTSRDESYYQTMPSLGRHRRGCNCKKCACLKKYCECYQAGVGCTDGCRCEGCENAYGKKEGSGEVIDSRHIRAKDGQWEEHLSEGKLYKRQIHLDNMPQTSLFQFSDQGNDIHNTKQPARTLPISSPESESLMSSPSDLNGSNRLMIAGQVNPAAIPFSPETECNITQLAKFPQSKATALTSSNVQDFLKASQTQTFYASVGSARSSVTSNLHFGGSNFVTDTGFDSELT